MAGIGETEGAFNPAVPTIQESSRAEKMLSYSKGTKQIESAKGPEYALEGLGKGLHTAASGFNYAIERGAEEAAHPRIDALRDEFSNTLDRINEERKNRPGPARSPAGPDSLLTPRENLGGSPGDLKTIDTKAGIYDLARANGKISETDYYARMDQLRKEFVSNYPGYRDFIDRMFEKYTGFNSANKLVESKIRDYNATISSKKTEADKAIDFIRTHVMNRDPVLGTMMVDGIRKGGDVDAAIMIASSSNAQHYDMERQKLALQLKHEQRQDVKDQAYAVGIQDVNRVANDVVQGFLFNAGSPNKQSVQDLLTQWHDNPDSFNAKQGEQLLQLLKGARQQIISRVESDWSKTTKEGQLPFSSVIGDKKGEAYKNGLYELDQMIDSLSNEHTGLLASHARSWKARIDHETDRLTGTVPAYVVGAAIRRLMGNQSSMFETSMINAVQGVNTPTTQEQIKAIIRYAAAQEKDLTVSRDGSFPLKHGLINIDSAEGAKAVTDIVPWATREQKLTDAVKANILHSAFSSANEGFIKAINKGPQDFDMFGAPLDTRRDDQQDVFNKWTSKETFAEVKRLSAHEPKLLNEYIHWVGSEASYLYTSNIINLNKAIFSQKENGYEISLVGDPNNPRLAIKQSKPNFGIPADKPELYTQRLNSYDLAQREVNRINGLFAAFSDIAVANKTDARNSIKTFLEQPGMNGAITDLLKQALANSNAPLNPDKK